MDHRRAQRTTFWQRVRLSHLLLCSAAVGLPHLSAQAQFLNANLAESPAAPPSIRDSVVIIARAQIGARYRIGGASPERGFDCSGLVQYVMSRVDLSLPRTARDQATLGVVVERDTSQLRPGDLLLFSTRERGPVSHIGIYVGHGRFIHASSVARRVVETRLDRPPAPRIKRWRGVRRIPWTIEEFSPDVVPTPER